MARCKDDPNAMRRRSVTHVGTSAHPFHQARRTQTSFYLLTGQTWPWQAVPHCRRRSRRHWKRCHQQVYKGSPFVNFSRSPRASTSASSREDQTNRASWLRRNAPKEQSCCGCVYSWHLSGQSSYPFFCLVSLLA